MNNKPETISTAVIVGDCDGIMATIHRLAPLHMKWRENHPDGKFRGSGLWSSWKMDGKLVLSFDVGCRHDHDCCGCVCSKQVVITPLGARLFAVVTHVSYNV